jgi:phage terminase large subunit
MQIPEAFSPLFKPSRYKVFYGGRGAAKSHNFARALLLQGMERPMLNVCAREIQKSIKDSVHRLLESIIREHELDGFYKVLETEIRGSNGTEFIFRGLKHNTTDIKSLEGADRLWVEEAENVSDNSWEIVIPTIRKAGSEIWVSFNCKNPTDPTYERFVKTHRDDAIVHKVSWRDNPFFPAVLETERRALQLSDPEAYAHIWEGEFDTRRSGAVYARQIAEAREAGRICRVPYDPGSEVFTAWDLGFGDSTAIWFLQFVGRELRWIDFYENSGEPLAHYAKLVKSKPYNYASFGHYLPHDGGAANITGDSASRQLYDLGISNTVLTRETEIAPGLELVRQTLAFSALDAEKCSDGLHALEHYAYEWDEVRSVFKNKPLHNWASHAADAARYAARAAALLKGNITNDAPKTDKYARKTERRGSWMAG